MEKTIEITYYNNELHIFVHVVDFVGEIVSVREYNPTKATLGRLEYLAINYPMYIVYDRL